MFGLKKIQLPAVFAALLTMVILGMSAPVMAQTPVEQIRLAPDELNPGAEYGRSVAMDGDLVAVGAGNADTETLPNAGAVYLYRRHGQAYIPDAILEAPDPSDDAEFGRAVAIQGNRIFVGARFAEVGGLRVGAVYVYRKYNKSWNFEQKIISPVPEAEDNFGRALAVQGSLLLVTARKESQNASDVGGAYVYLFKGGSWTFQQKLTASDPTSSAYFGQSVAVQGGLVAIGARNADPDAAGAVYLFRQSGNEWQEIAKVVPDDGNKNDNFGFSIAISGNLLVVGARRADTAEVEDTGAVYVYSLEGDSANFVARLTAGDSSEG
ncbi:MAG: FG-GAP repeat protein, partial [Desulforhabdus sp.]|nr:FG-GAP repeat protein [Desulforhabdus sp.]